MILLHGTTRWRAEQIVLHGPVRGFREPAGLRLETQFFVYLENGPFSVGTPEDYARGKARLFPDEGGAVILALDVPEEIVLRALDENNPMDDGIVGFERGFGLEELLAAWAAVARTASIWSVE